MAGPIEEQDEAITAINVVPLVDIVLVLLIVFMVTATLMVKPAIEMELPRAETGERKERNQFSLLLGADGSAAIGERRFDPRRISEELSGQLSAYKAEARRALREKGGRPSEAALELLARRELTMVIQADRRVAHGRVIHAIDQARRVGIQKYAFNIEEKQTTVPVGSGAVTESSSRGVR